MPENDLMAWNHIIQGQRKPDAARLSGRYTVAEAIRCVVDYLSEDEGKDFSYFTSGDNPEKHIFVAVTRLERFLSGLDDEEV